MQIDYEKYARIFKVMSDPKRLKIIDMLSGGELCALRTTAEVSACLYFQNRNRTDPGNRGSVGGMCGTSYEIEQLNLEVGYEYKSNWKRL